MGKRVLIRLIKNDKMETITLEEITKALDAKEPEEWAVLSSQYEPHDEPDLCETIQYYTYQTSVDRFRVTVTQVIDEIVRGRYGDEDISCRCGYHLSVREGAESELAHFTGREVRELYNNISKKLEDPPDRKRREEQDLKLANSKSS